MARSKPQILTFRKPVEILEVWRSTRLFEKNDHAAQQRTRPVDWTPFTTPFGRATPEGLCLDTGAAAVIDSRVTQVLLLLSDHPSANHQSYAPAGAAAQAGPRPVKLDVFRALPQGDWPVILTFPSYLYPNRDSYQLCTLKPGETVEIRVNGKSDGYHQRMYLEYAYLFRRSGPYREALVTDGLPFDLHPPNERTLIDLRKPLW